jgi:uncharacterized membrane protein YbaN (DUF454 family)
MSYIDYQTCQKHNYFGAYSCPKCWKEKEAQKYPPKWMALVFIAIGFFACWLSAEIHDAPLVLAAGCMFYMAILALTKGK